MVCLETPNFSYQKAPNNLTLTLIFLKNTKASKKLPRTIFTFAFISFIKLYTELEIIVTSRHL